MEEQQREYLPRPALFLLNTLLAVTTFMYVLDYSVANVAIPYISGSLAVSTDQGTYVITAFAVGNAIGLPSTGWLADRLGRIRTFLLSIALFTFFSWMCGATIDFDTLIVGRFLQGLAAGPIIPLSQGFVGELNPPERRNKATAFWTMIVITAPVVGPVIGGWICVNYTWPWIFFINIPLGIICTIGIGLILKGRESKIKIWHFDFLGFLLLAIGATTLQIFLDKGQDWDWFNSNVIRTLLVTSILSFSFLGFWQFITPKPFMNLRLFKIRSFAIACLLMAVAYGCYFGSIVVVPLWLQSYMGYDAYWAGLAIAPLGICPVLFSPILPKLIENIGKLFLLMFTMVVFILSFIMTMNLTPQASIQEIAFPRFIMGVGFSTFAAPMMILSMQDLTTEQSPMGLGIFHFVRSLFGGIGTSVFVTIWQRRSIFHHFNLSQWINPYRAVSENAFGTLESLGMRYKVAQDAINDMVDQQAAMLALLDAFYVMAWACFALLVIIMILRITSKSKIPFIEKLKTKLRP